ncbi:MAG: hypothetical protein B1H12_08660 [Desulfobacteraceae bacterium 4484_190.2]|nr:MAG: hypothetical protein B1H12_08660 [Desulfobacteraceae bacterium 4484_190.2]
MTPCISYDFDVSLQKKASGLDRLNLSINRLIQNIVVKKDHGVQRLPLHVDAEAIPCVARRLKTASI